MRHGLMATSNPAGAHPAGCKRSRLALAAASALALAAAALPAPAQAQFYSYSGSNSTSPGNQFPLGTATAVLDLSAYNMEVGIGAPGSFSALSGAQLALAGLWLGSRTTPVTRGNGQALLDNARVTLGGGNGRLGVGNGGDGLLTVQRGSLLDGTANAAACTGGWCNSYIGFRAGASATLNITGAGSEVRLLGYTGVGDVWMDAYGGTAGGTSSGTIKVLNGATLRTQATDFGGGGTGGPNALGTAHSAASAVIDGTGSLWSVSNNTVDGWSTFFDAGRSARSDASLTVQNNGTMRVDIGSSNSVGTTLGTAGGRAVVLVDSGGQFLVSGAATSTAQSFRNGYVAIGGGNYGQGGAGGTGKLTVQGNGSLFSVSGANVGVTVGETGGSGRLDVLNQGRAVMASGVTVGNRGGQGEVNVIGGRIDITGTGGRFMLSGNSTVKVSGGGLIDATGEAASCAGNVCGNILANGAGSSGLLEISGRGSAVRLLRAFSAGSGYVDPFTGTAGGTTQATLRILDGGLLATEGLNALGGSSSGALANGSEHSFADVLISGVGAKWQVSRNSVDSGDVIVGVGTSATGSAQMTNQAGGQLRIDGTGRRGQFDGINIGSSGRGTVTVSGVGSSLVTLGPNPFVNVGANNSDGNGSFNILAGATASAMFGNVGRNGGTGSLLISGSGSQLLFSGVGITGVGGTAGINIGRNGSSGTVVVQAGGKLSINDGGADTRPAGGGAGLGLGRDANGVGTLLITGAGSLVELASSTLVPAAGVADNFNPSMSIGYGQASATGALTVANGGKLVLTGNALSTAAANRTTALNIGGSSDTVAGTVGSGTGSAVVTGAGSQIRVQGVDGFIVVGRNGTGSLTVANAGLVATSIMNVGRGTAGVGTLLVNNGTLELTGQHAGSGSGGGLAIGNRGGTASATLTNGSQLLISNAGSGGAGLSLGGTALSPLGQGTFNLSGGSSVVVQGAAGVSGVVVGRDGSGFATVSGASRIHVGDAEVLLARNTGSFGQMTLADKSSVTAGYVGVGSRIGGIDGGLARLIVNTSTVTATTLEIGSQGTLGGTGGTINANVINRGTISPGNSPGDLVINGGLQNRGGGHLLLEIAADGAGGFITDRLIFGNASGTQDLQHAAITFAFLGSVDALAFLSSGQFDLDTFLRSGDSSGSSGLSSTFAAGTHWTDVVGTQQLSVSAANDSITGLTLGADGAIGGTLTAVPEPLPSALLLAGLAVLGWMLQRRAHRPLRRLYGPLTG